MNTFRTIIAVIFASSFLLTSETFGKTAVIVAISTSGIESEVLEQPKQTFLARIAQLGKQRKFKNAPLFIDDFSSGQGIWKGSPKDLLKGKRAESVLAGIQRNPRTCSNLTAGFRKISSRIRQLKFQGYDEISIFVWSSLIDTGANGKCSKKITVPQLPPSNVRFDRIFHQEEVHSLTFLAVNQWQENTWREALEPTMEFLSKGNKALTLNGKAETEDLLGRKVRTWLTSY